MKNLGAIILIVAGALLAVEFGPTIDIGGSNPEIGNVFAGAIKGAVGGAAGGVLAWLLFDWRRKERPHQ